MTKLFRAGLLAVLLTQAAVADDYRVAVSQDPPADLLSAKIAPQIASRGVKVMRGEKRTVCEIWPAKAWPAEPAAKTSSSVLYPFHVGQLMGAIRFKRKSNDFKDQEIASGTYTLRYGHQPVDGNHVGTSDTRDFLVLIPADADLSPDPLAEKDMFKLSAKAAGTKHPAIFPLIKPAAGPVPAVRHVEDKGWWAVRLAPDNKADAAGGAIELVIVGKSGER